MAYNKTNWQNGTSPSINQANLNNLETGVENANNPSYSTTVDQSTVRTTVLSGNKKGYINQTVQGNSVINSLGEKGGFYEDSDGDGLADFINILNTVSNLSLIDSVQSFTPDVQFAGIYTLSTNTSASDIIYAYADIKSTDVNTRISLFDGVVGNQSYHSGSGNFERLSTIITANNSNMNVYVNSENTSGFTEIQAKNMVSINLTKTFGVGNEPGQNDCDVYFSKYFDNIGSYTPTLEITGSNQKYELTEPYTVQKTPNGVYSEIVLVNNQNILNSKHKNIIISDVTISDFQTYTNHYRGRIDDFVLDNDLLSLTNLSGLSLNNNLQLYVRNTGLTSDLQGLYLDTNDLYIYLPKTEVDPMPSGGTATGFEEYLKEYPFHCVFQTNSITEIPIKSLQSIEDGTITNNSCILPSSITYTTTDNIAAVSESNISDYYDISESQTIYKGAFATHKQGERTVTQKNAYSGAFLTRQTNTDKNGDLIVNVDTTSEYSGAFLTKKKEVIR